MRNSLFSHRFERDVSMKRQLIDELRIKSKENETKLKDEYNAKVHLTYFSLCYFFKVRGAEKTAQIFTLD